MLGPIPLAVRLFVCISLMLVCDRKELAMVRFTIKGIYCVPSRGFRKSLHYKRPRIKLDSGNKEQEEEIL
jgi:hypothetical protein